MPLQKQVISLPIVGGLNEKEDALLSVHPQQMTNCVYRKTGAVSKRYGYTCIGPYNTRRPSGSPPAGEMLATYKDELLRIGGGRLDSFNPIAGVSDWLERGQVPEVTGAKRPIAAADAGIVNYSNPNVAVANGYSVTTYVTRDGANYRVFADVFNIATGACVDTQHLFDQRSTPLSGARVSAVGHTAGVFWHVAAENKIYGSILDLNTLQWGTPAIALSSIPNGQYDIQAISDTEFLAAFNVSAGTNRLYLQSIRTTTVTTPGYFDAGSGGAIAGTTDLDPTSISLRYVAGERVWVAASYADLTPATFVKVFSANPTTYVFEAGIDTVFTEPSSVGIEVCAIERLSSTRAVVAWTRNNNRMSWQEVQLSAGTLSNVYGSERNLYRAQLLSRPFVNNGRAYALVANIHGTHGTHYLVDLYAQEAMPTGATARLVSTMLPRQLGSISATEFASPGTSPRYRSVSNVEATGVGGYVVASTVAGLETGAFAIAGIGLAFGARRTTVESANLLIMGGGAPSAYDGTRVFELGFAYEPDVAYLAAFTSAASGGLLAATQYNYKFVYAWKDAQGNLFRSAPSLPVTFTTGVGHGTINGTLPPLQLTNRIGSADAARNVRIEIYRTTTTGVYKRVKSVQNVLGAPIAFSDIMANAELDANATLYTTGGVLDHVAPASASIVHVWKNAVFLAGTDDDSIWVSGDLVAREGPWFNDATAIDPFEGGPVTALSSLDATLVIFKSDGIWIVDGEPPNDLGISTLTMPRRVQTDVGCTDAASIAQTPEGIYFKGRTGLYLLNRSLQVLPVGRAVEDSYRAEGFAGAVTLPAQGLVRWLQRGSGGYDALNLDAYHTNIYGSPVWSKDTLADVRGATVASPVGCAMWRGAFVWLSAAGYLYQESSTSYGDANGLGVTAWVPMTFETGFEKPGNPSELQRVWRTHILGARASAHDITVTLTTDMGVEARTWTAAEVDAFPSLPAEKLMIHVAAQKSRYLKVKIADAQPASGTLDTYAGMTLRDVSLVLGVKGGGARVTAAQRK